MDIAQSACTRLAASRRCHSDGPHRSARGQTECLQVPHSGRRSAGGLPDKCAVLCSKPASAAWPAPGPPSAPAAVSSCLASIDSGKVDRTGTASLVVPLGWRSALPGGLQWLSCDAEAATLGGPPKVEPCSRRRCLGQSTASVVHKGERDSVEASHA